VTDVARENVPRRLPDISEVSSVDSFEELYPIPQLMSSNDKHFTEYASATKVAAKELHTRVYLEKGFITPDDLNSDGVFTDEYSERAVYIIAHSKNRRSACRYFPASRKDGLMSLPTPKHFSLDPETIKETAGVRRLTDIKANEVIEVSGLVSVKEGDDLPDDRGELNATRLVYAQILRESLDAGHKLWLLNTHESLVRSLKMLVGREQVNVLGEVRDYMGSPTVPVAINPQEVVRAALEDQGRLGDMKREYLKETLKGVSDRHLPDDILALLDKNDIAYEKSSNLQRLLRNRKALAMAALSGYALARAVPVANVDEFHGSAAIFAGIDLATVPPYAWGLAETVAGKTIIKRSLGAVAAAGSFAAPYAYFWAEGHDYPAYVNFVVGGIVTAAAGLEARKYKKEEALKKHLFE